MILAERQLEGEGHGPNRVVSGRNPRRRLSVVRSQQSPTITETRKRYRLRMGRFLVTVALIFIMGFILVSGYSRLSTMAYHVAELTRQIDKLHAENDYLRLQISRLETPSRVEETARQKGMNYGAELKIADVDPDMVAAAARTNPQPNTVVMSLLDAPRTDTGEVQLATAGSSESLEAISQWFFRWLTGVRTAEARPIR